MTNLYFKTAFLLSLLLSFSYLEEGNTKTIDVNHGGICDTYLECGKMLCSDYRRACCVNGKCICRKPGQNVPNCPN
ncbi:unnamed protein product [Arabidopsis lyrata]|uniref:Uncharacterized protein n=1 Tax=Arabidopsis lyrata subsp. lyrata TaxID=81972 RepID=D7MKZ6_ARALL|nr:hypothetical protein ARALYDRAFT_330900 [Arabidopsis lyrata subsp. lyrata]CAH8278297.1 unnamed protein product [Arabidopsis lyrata]